MRYITTTKNLFDNIIPSSNCRVSFSTSRAIATQINADTATSRIIKIAAYNGSSFEMLSFVIDTFALGRIIRTFTTPETTGYEFIVFGLNGVKIDTTCQCNINLKPSTTYTFSCNFTNITQGSISWTDMQLEEGSSATPYVPYGYLPMYKGRYKVSNVCQLLDKSTYPATKTVNGVTFTNNGDGSYTANGTPSGLGYLSIASLSNLIVGHKYYSPSSEYSNGIYIETKIDRKNADTIWVSNQIREWEENDTMMYITLIADPNSAPTVENAKLIPQLFDLTEMYGAGNEPTTVAEFREKFPDDLYPYSPYCWAKIKSLIYKDNIDYIKMK